MAFDQSTRNLMKSHYENGKTASEIYQILAKKVTMRSIQRWVKRIQEKKSLQCNTSPGRPKTVRTKSLIQKIKRNFCFNKKRKSANKLAKENICSDRSIRRIIHEDLGLKTYKKIKVPSLADKQIKKRFQFSMWIRKNFNHESCKKICFSDEKMFDADGQFNPKNDVIYADSRKSANLNGGLIRRKKYPSKVMVWCMVTWNGPSQALILPAGASFNSKFYASKVIPIIKQTCVELMGNDFIFQQDGATCHTAKISIETFQKLGIPIIGPDHWPPNSPDLNPLDYFFWNEVSKRVTAKKPTNRDSLIKEINNSIQEIPLKMIRDAIQNFRSRVYAVEKNQGNLIINDFA